MPAIRPLKDLEAGDCDLTDLLFVYNPMIRFHFNEDPDKLSDDEFAIRVKELRWLSDEGFLEKRIEE